MLKKTLDLLNSTAELRKLIIENPDLPLIVFAGDEANNEGYSSAYCSKVFAYIGEILDCENDACDRIYDDRIEFEETLFDKLDEEYPKLSSEELDDLLKKRMNEYEPYWKKCIILHVDN